MSPGGGCARQSARTRGVPMANQNRRSVRLPGVWGRFQVLEAAEPSGGRLFRESEPVRSRGFPSRPSRRDEIRIIDVAIERQELAAAEKLGGTNWNQTRCAALAGVFGANCTRQPIVTAC